MVELPLEYKLGKSYILFPLEERMFEAFPETIECNDEVLYKKSSFHVSLSCFKGVSDIVAEDKLVSFFNDFVRKTPILFNSFGDEFRFVEKDERKTIVLPCTMSNLEEFFVALNQEFDINIPTLPTHVTLYTLQKDVGIGINSSEDMISTEVISIPELSESLAELKLK